MRAWILICALALMGFNAAAAPELNGKCTNCHSVATDQPSSLLLPAILNAAGATGIIERAISTISPILQMRCLKQTPPPNPPPSTPPFCLELSAEELSALDALLKKNVPTTDAGSTPPNVAKAEIDLGVGTTLFFGKPVSAFTRLEPADQETTYGRVEIREVMPGTWKATYRPKVNEAGRSDSFSYVAKGAFDSGARTVSIRIDPPAAPNVDVGALPRIVALNADSFDVEVFISGGLANAITNVGTSSGMVWPQDGIKRGTGTLTLVAPALNATLPATATATFRYRPPRDGFGNENFDITVVPAGVEVAKKVATLSFRVDPVPATVNAATLMVQLNTPTPLDLKPFIGGSEISGVRIASEPAHGKATINGTVLTYTPRRNYFGPDEFTWSAFGVLGESMMTSTVSVQVVGRPDPSQDPDVRGLVAAQTGAAQRFAWAQIDHLQRRLERLHRRTTAGGGSAASGGASLDALPAMRSPVPQHEAARTAFASEPDQTARSAFARAPTRAAADGGAAPHAGPNGPHALANTSPLSLIGELAQLVESGGLDLGGAARLGLLPGVGSAADADAGLWLAGRVSLGRRPAQSGQSALAIDSDSATLGFDRRFGSKLSLGLAFGATRERARIGEVGSDNRATGESIALYGSVRSGDAFFIDAMLGQGRLRMDSRRVVEPIDDVARLARRGRVDFGAIAFGLEHEIAPLVLAPYARFDVARHRLGEATETGAGAYALRYLAQRGQHQRLALGLRVEAPHETDFGSATPWLRAEFQRELKGEGSAQVAYADLPGTLYTIVPTTTDRHNLALGAGLELFSKRGGALALEYQLQTASGRLRSQGLQLQWTQHWGSGLLPPLPPLTDVPLDLLFDLGLTWDDNITRGKDAGDRLDDIVQRVGVSHDKVFALSASTQAVLRGTLAAEALRRYPRLSRGSAEAQGELRWRPSAEFGAPTTIAFASAAYDDFRSALRDGGRYALGVALRMPLTDRLAAAGTLAYNARRARSAVFDLDDTSLRLALDWRPGERGLYYGSAELRSGDIVSSGRRSLENLDLAERFVADDAFGSRELLSYRFKARVGVLRLGANWRLGADSSVDLSWSRSVAVPRDELAVLQTPRYFAGQVRAVYLVRY